MQGSFAPAVRASRLSRSVWLIPAVLLPALCIAGAGYGAGRLDEMQRAPRTIIVEAASAPITTIDASSQADNVFSLVKFDADEMITQIGNAYVTWSGPWMATHGETKAGRPGSYLTLTTNKRRIVMLFH